eukprot:TRINITY_DN1001_c0_g4_i1.p1 TRINITY_DN1001_c0_g4~~TRINITY_DN1001_c0_g4_i1.p1  ORF type:complete len:446 (+),score=101.28 TRINITY_DN1001_c0_g4_i1:46-1338(+)
MTEKGIKASQPISKKGTFGTLSRELKLAAGTLLEVHEKKVKKMLPLDQMQRVEHDAASQRVLLKNAPGHEDWEFVFKSGGTYSTFADFLEKGVNEERRRKGQEPLPLNDSITSAKDKNKKAAPLKEAVSQVKQKKQQEQQRQQQEQQQREAVPGEVALLAVQPEPPTSPPQQSRGLYSVGSGPSLRYPLGSPQRDEQTSPQPLRPQRSFRSASPSGVLPVRSPASVPGDLSPTQLSVSPRMQVTATEAIESKAMVMAFGPSPKSTPAGHESEMESLSKRLHHLAVEYRKGEVTEEQYLHEKRDLMHRIDMAGDDPSPRGSMAAPASYRKPPAALAEASGDSHIFLRSGPGPSYKWTSHGRVFGPFEVIHCHGEWAFVRCGNAEGYVREKYLTYPLLPHHRQPEGLASLQPAPLRIRPHALPAPPPMLRAC